MELRELTQKDWPAVKAIYEEGIAAGSTFATEAPSWEEWDRAHLEGHRLVAVQDGELVGWAALSPTSTRSVYRGVARNAVYVAAEARGRGVGRRLLHELIEGADRDGLWTIEAWMFPENEASVRLHKTCGFRVVGVRERIGEQYGVWRDVVVMERRADEEG